MMSRKESKTRRKFIKTACTASAMALVPGRVFRTSQESSPQEFLAACREGNQPLVAKMLENNPALLTAQDENGRSGFTLAKLQGHQQVSDFLKGQGYETDLHEAALDLDWDRFDVLVGDESEETKGQINAYHPMGGSVMWAAAAGGASQDIWRVYAKCANPNTEFPQASTPVEQALQYADLATAEMTAAALLSNHADPDPPNGGKNPPLHLAAQRGSLEMVELIIRLGANVDRKNSGGKTALQLAQEFGHHQVADLILNEQEIPRVCQTSRTAYNALGENYEVPVLDDIPLYLRRRLVGQAHGNLEYVEKEVTADPRLVHAQATTSEISVEACAHIGRKPIVDFLLNLGAPYSINTAVMMNDITTVQKYLEEDPKRIHERGAHHFALLWYPIIGKCDLAMMELLLTRGAEVEDQHFLGTTALHWACLRGPIDMVALLVENGADVNRVGRKFKPAGETPLQMARDEKIIQYLKSRGAM